MHAGDLPREVAERIRRPAPHGCFVVPGSLPVVSFGDYRTAEVATLALNPSAIEFEDTAGRWLSGASRRLASLRSLGVADAAGLDDAAVAQAFRESIDYFRGSNWYRAWFHWLQSLLVASGVGSYLDASACHLDLVQWATRPAQGRLPGAAWRTLVDDDRDFLLWQLEQTSATTVLVNGASCVEWLRLSGVVPSWTEERLSYRVRSGRSSQLRLFGADARGRRFVGWNRPLAQALPAEARSRLAEWVAATAR